MQPLLVNLTFIQSLAVADNLAAADTVYGVMSSAYLLEPWS